MEGNGAELHPLEAFGTDELGVDILWGGAYGSYRGTGVEEVPVKEL